MYYNTHTHTHKHTYYYYYVPGAVDSRDGISFLTSMSKESKDIISSDDTSRNKINKRNHDLEWNGMKGNEEGKKNRKGSEK